MKSYKVNSNDDTDFLSIISALAYSYLNVFIVFPEDNLATTLKLEGYVTRGIKDAPKKYPYDDMLKTYTKYRVFSDDVNLFYDTLASKNLNLLFSNPDKKQFELTYRVIENNEIHFYSANYTRISKDNEPLRLVCGFRNIDKIKNEKTKLHSDGLYKAYSTLSKIYLCMHRIDVKNDVYYEIKATENIRKAEMYNNPSATKNFENIMKYTVSENFIKPVLDFTNLKTLSERMKSRDNISMEFYGKYNGWCRATFIKEDEDENGDISHVLFTVEIINEEKQKENVLRHLAETDYLTGMLNRRSGTQQIEDFISKNKEGMFCILDIDHFKTINDTFGHDIGDEVIIKVANSFKEIVKNDGIAMRLGGDEFSVFLPGVLSKEITTEFFDKLADTVSKIKLPKEDFKITISGGAYPFKANSNIDFNYLYKNADEALYRSKKLKGSIIQFAF